MLAIYSSQQQTFYDVSFIGEKVNLIRRYKIGMEINMFKYGTNSNVGLYIFNNRQNVDTIKLGEKELVRNLPSEKRVKEKDAVEGKTEEKETKEKEKEKRPRILQRESKIIKPSSEPHVNQQIVEVRSNKVDGI